MQKVILLNNQIFRPSLSNLPCLVHGAPKAGSSLFTVSLIADLYVQGYKILFLSGYRMARDEFIQQTSANDYTILENEPNLKTIGDNKVIFVKRENVDWFLRLIDVLPDINDRVILVKNFDLFNEEVFQKLKDKRSYIFSGDLDSCPYAKSILEAKFSTRMLFSQPKIQTRLTLPQLEPYHGHMWGKNEGIISLKI